MSITIPAPPIEKRLYEAIGLLESTANLLRGMTFDPRLPREFATILRERARKIDAFTDECPECEEGGEE